MLSKTRGIVLHSVPYNDIRYIIHIYTEAFGRVSCLANRAKGRKNTVSKALFMPLSVIEIEMERHPRRDFCHIRETGLCLPLSRLFTDPVKNALALFLAEVLSRVIKETEPDSRLFDYLYRSISILEDAGKGVANFHLVFLLHLLNYLGVFPNIESYRENRYFDMQNGVFTDSPPLHKHYLNRGESLVFARLFRINFENMSFYDFSRHDRVNILNRIIAYYRLHLPEIPEIKSLPILQILFD
jgi:DNA repair protein RecO (recombination protein O)